MSTLQHLLALALAREADPKPSEGNTRPSIASTSMTSIRTLTHYHATSPPIFGDVVFIISWPNVVNYSFTLVLDKHPCKVIPRERIAAELQQLMNKCSVVCTVPVCTL